MADYNLDALGWFQFERLCQTLLKATYSVAIESWGGSSDRGIDAYFDGRLDYPNRRLPTTGRFVFQAKFVAGANAAGANYRSRIRAAVSEEIAAIKKRTQSGEWDTPSHYTLLTNAPISASVRTEVSAQIVSAMPRCTVSILAASDLDAMLDINDSIRLSYPQLLGLRDLRQLIGSASNSEALNRSKILFEITQELAQVYVPTSAHNNALTQLDRNNFAVLTGPPEMGKTSTARMIALARLSGGWDAHECIHPGDFFRLYDPSRAQVFVADDAFGSTEYRPDLAYEWARDLEKILAAADHRHWVIWTSRPAPLEQALGELHFQGKARNFPVPSRVQVNLGVLNQEVKAQILYRHAKAAGLSEEQRDAVKSLARTIVLSPHFTPLRIFRLVKDDLPGILDLPENQRESAFRSAVEAGLRTPTSAITTSFRALPLEHKRMLISMLDASSRSTTRSELEQCYARHAPEGTTIAPEKVLQMLDDHFLDVMNGDDSWN